MAVNDEGGDHRRDGNHRRRLLERERRKKEAGLRTFGFIALLGSVGAALGDPYAYIILAFTALLTVFLNLQEFHLHKGTELTTSAAMLVTCVVGI